MSCGKLYKAAKESSQGRGRVARIGSHSLLFKPSPTSTRPWHSMSILYHSLEL